MTGSEAMVRCLENEHVKVMFGYPGAAISPFYDALTESGIHHVLVRSEQHAAHAASGYARITGKVGVCVVTSGPGATNLLTGIATAYMDSIPLVVFTGQVRTELLGSDVFQEADVTGAAEPFTKHSYLVKNARELPRVIKEAFYIAATGRPGPVLIDVPVDIQNAAVADFDYDTPVDIIGYKPSTSGHALQIERAVHAIKASRRPLICAGGGIFTAGAQEALRKFSERCRIPVIHTLMGVGALPSLHPMSLGMLGSHGVASANKAFRDADLLILAGARVGDRSVAAPGQVAQRAKIIHIDIDPAEIGKNMPVTVPIVGDLKQVLSAFADAADFTAPAEWTDEVTARRHRHLEKDIPPVQGFVEPKSFMRLLSRCMPENGILCADVGQNQIWSANNYEIREGRFLTSGGMGTMGYAIPCAAGSQIAAPDKTVCAVCGDGSFQMSMSELAVICQEKLPVKIVVMRNTRLGMVRELQYKLHKARYSAVFLDGSPDIVKIAQAYGIPAAVVSADADVRGAVNAMLSSEGPYLLECVVPPDYPSL